MKMKINFNLEEIIVRTQGGYRTKQRDVILELLKRSTERHLSAEDICDILRSNGERVGAATVYRYLEKLYSEGLLQKYNTDGRAMYTYTEKECRSHFHLKCTECGRLFCADCSFLTELCKHIKGDHNFLVSPSKTVFYGVCSECTKESEVES